MRTTLVFLMFFPVTTGWGQADLDSLWAVWNDERQPDTARLEAMYSISWNGYLFTQPDSAFYFAQLEYDFAKSKGLKKQMAKALNIQGISFWIQSDYTSAIDHYTRSLTISEEIGDKNGVSASLNNIGGIYSAQGDYASAIDYYTRSLTIDEEVGNKQGVSYSLNNIGGIYAEQGDYANAINYHTRSLTIKEEMGNKKGIAASLANIGGVYMDQGAYASAMDFYTRSLTIMKDIGNKKGIAISLNNIGIIYKKQGDSAYSAGNIALSADKYTSAIDYQTRSLAIYEEIGDKQGVATSLNNIGLIYTEKGDNAKAISYCGKALAIAQEVGAATETRDAANALYEAYKATGRHSQALEMYELYIATRDSIESEENQKEVIRQQFKYDYEKQSLADSLEFAKEQEVKDLQINEQQAQLKQEATQRYALMGGGALFFILALVAFRSYRLKRRDNLVIAEQKQEVEHQKDLVDEKNKEITDSITYAKRIQEAILPPDKLVKEYLKESFVLYKPKDIVAGDFYWMVCVSLSGGGQSGKGQGEEIHLPSPPSRWDNLILFAVADCTGHGVPGAMVSVVCHNALNRAVREFNLTNPGKILDKVRELVIETFHAYRQTGEKSDREVKDGMDIALCALHGTGDKGQVKLEYAGANNPLWVFRKGITEAEQIEETKADKQPIGKYAESKPFTSHSLTLKEGDSIYLFSDGFADQFGGPKGKKFKYKPFKQLLLQMKDKEMKEQRQALDTAFEEWKGELEQVDDVCIIGVRV